MEDNKTVITAEMQVEEIMEQYPQTVTYFILNKVSPFSCAGAYPTTLREMLVARNVIDIDAFIAGLNQYLCK